ncbi:MAG: UDP-N-acetylmuramate dehydrogenase [Chitinophagaceae bacterium]
MDLQKHYSLRSCNSFGIDVYAGYFSIFRSVPELRELLSWTRSQNKRLLILGGGSNILFTSDFEGLVIKNEIRGITETGEDENFVFVKAGAGESWQSLVEYAVSRNFGGIENLSLIPGTVGASPIQNIGAYGVELKDTFYQLEAIDISTGRLEIFHKENMDFGYRDSIFKRGLKNKMVISNVSLRLSKNPLINTSYGAIAEQLTQMQMQMETPGIREVSDAVISIRKSKLPDPAVIGNAGSFFKNPEVAPDQFNLLKISYPSIPGYPGSDNKIKLAAGWMIEQCGWKGYRNGDAGCHTEQALVLVNYGNATGEEIYALSARILESVQERFGILLEREVNML